MRPRMKQVTKDELESFLKKYPRPDSYTYWEGSFLVLLWMEHFIPFFCIKVKQRRLDVSEIKANKKD